MLCVLSHLLAVFTFYFKRNVNKEDNIDSSGEQSATATLLLYITTVQVVNRVQQQLCYSPLRLFISAHTGINTKICGSAVWLVVSELLHAL